MSHTMTLWERIIYQRIRQIVELDHIHFGFMKGRSTTEPIFALRIRHDNYREEDKDLHVVFFDLLIVHLVPS